MSEPTFQVRAGFSAAKLFHGHVNQLRDPPIHVEDDRVFLLNALAGESGIGLTEVFFDE